MRNFLRGKAPSDAAASSFSFAEPAAADRRPSRRPSWRPSSARASALHRAADEAAALRAHQHRPKSELDAVLNEATDKLQKLNTLIKKAALVERRSGQASMRAAGSGQAPSLAGSSTSERELRANAANVASALKVATLAAGRLANLGAKDPWGTEHDPEEHSTATARSNASNASYASSAQEHYLVDEQRQPRSLVPASHESTGGKLLPARTPPPPPDVLITAVPQAASSSYALPSVAPEAEAMQAAFGGPACARLVVNAR